MPRIPVRTEPYTSPTRQHRHFKSKRDLILRTLGKSSYINHSQFLVCFLSAKGEIETYASEMLQDSVDEVLDMDVLARLAAQVREGADRKREQLEELQKRRREEGGAVDGAEDWTAEMEPAEVASQVLRSAKKAKAERVAAEKAMASAALLGMEGEGDGGGLSGKGKGRARDPPMTPLRQVQRRDMTLVVDEEGEDEEGEGEDEYEEEEAEKPLDESIGKAGHANEVALASVDLAAPVTEPKKEQETEHQGDVTLVDTPSLATPNDGAISALKRKLDDTPRIAPTLRQVQVTMAGSPLSLRSMSKGSTSKRGMLMSATPARPIPFAANGFVTPSTHDGLVAPTPKSGRGLMNNVLEGSSVKKRQQPKIMLGPSLIAEKPHIPRPLAHVRTPSHAAGPPTAATPYTPSVQTRSITIPYRDLIDWYANRFDSLQQATCKLVVKSWIKVIEPKKQSKFPYNRGEDCRPDWWPEHIRHREPDHLQKPERTQILVSLIRSSLAPISKLELSTAEQTAYINQPRMKILRDIYKVAKEDERRRALGDETSDIVVNVPASPPLKASITRMSILDEIAQQTDASRPRRTSNAATVEPRDLASPCVIHPSSLTVAAAAAHHAKTGSIGESVFLGAGALKKRKLDELAQGDKENIDPQGGKVRRSVALGQEELMNVRPLSTGAIRKTKQPSVARHSIGNHGFPTGSAEWGVSPMVQPPAARPWSTTGTRSGDAGWMSGTPMTDRQRLQHQGEGIPRSASTGGAPAHGMFANGMTSTGGGGGMNPHLGQTVGHSSTHVSAGMEMYITDGTQPPTNGIPIHAGRSFAVHPDPHAPPPVQYIPYGLAPHGMMPPFSNVPHQGTFMVYDPPTGSTNDRRRQSGSLHARNQHQQGQSGQAYVYPPYTPYQSLYISAEHEPNGYVSAVAAVPPTGRGMHPDSQGPMLSYPTGMTLLAHDEEAVGHEGLGGTRMGRTRTMGSVTPGGGRGAVALTGTTGTMMTAHLGMTISLPIPSGMTVAGDDGKPSNGSHDAREEAHSHEMMAQRQRTARSTLDDEDAHAIPMEPPTEAMNPTPSEMETVEREFVKFSDADGSDRDGVFWGGDSL